MDNSYSQLSDHLLLDRFRAGSTRAFEAMYDRYFGVLYIHANKMLHDSQEAQDIVQDIFIALWKKGAELTITTSLSAYLYVAVKNKVLTSIEQNAVQKKHLLSLCDFLADRKPYTHPLDYIQEKQLTEIIESGCRNLPFKMRQVFELSRKAGMSHREIAVQLKISEKTVKKQVNNAIRILKPGISYISSGIAYFIFF
jgi:RNA polymerase sigma-70 factor (ECF subfamily)